MNIDVLRKAFNVSPKCKNWGIVYKLIKTRLNAETLVK